MIRKDYFRPESTFAVLVSLVLLSACAESRPVEVGEMALGAIDAPHPLQRGYVTGQVTGYDGEVARLSITKIDVPEYNESELADVLRSKAKGDDAVIPVEQLSALGESGENPILAERREFQKAYDLYLSQWGKKTHEELVSLAEKSDLEVVDFYADNMGQWIEKTVAVKGGG